MSASGKHRHDDYLITTTSDGRSWHWLWDHHDEPLGIDHPSLWELCRDSSGVKLVHRVDQKEIEIRSSHLAGEKDLQVPAATGSREFSIHFKKLQRIRPAYMPDLAAIKNFGPAEHYVSAGIREHLISFVPVDAKISCRVEDEKLFEVVPSTSSFQVRALRPGVKFKPVGQESTSLNAGQTIQLSFTEIYSGAFIYGSYWWRFNKVPTPEMMSLDELDREEASQDVISLKQLGKFVAGLTAAAVALVQAVHYMQLYQDSHKKKPEAAQVELKKPKYIPLAEKPKPTPAPKLVEKPKPTPAPKVVEKPKPKRQPPKKVAQKPKRPEPPKKVVQKPAPAPKPVVQPKVVPPPVKVVQAPPAPPAPAKPQPVQPKAPDPSVVAAQQKAAVAKSLNFLSTGPSKNVNAIAKAQGGKLSQKYENTGTGALPATNSALNKLATANTGSGPITTSSARTVASNSGIKGGHGKGLNQVQGKVSLNALYGSGSGDALAGAMGGGMSVSGPGRLSDADIEKTLAKYLQKLQFCYEKALLSDSSLGGTIQIQWTITTAGSVRGQSVTRSEMQNAGLHACLMKEFGKMQFPRPKGGDVTVKKPFKFESSSI